MKVNGLIVVAIDVNGVTAAVNQVADANIPWWRSTLSY
jgi:ABC-type sugar transport system substrate-binding protein